MEKYKEIGLPVCIESREKKINELDGCSVVVSMIKGYWVWKKGHIFYNDSWPNNNGFYLIQINGRTNKLEKELIQINEVDKILIEE